jgi:glyoxylase-like metal-dependent hydrolase (beta-lactamase superfamily II)
VLQAYRALREESNTKALTPHREALSIEPVRLTKPGERLAAGPFRLEMIPVPGHDPYHVALYDKERRIAFTGDVVLPVATPITLPMGDDTATYLESLERLRTLPVRAAYPGHGGPIRKFEWRVERSLRFVTERHDLIRATLDEKGPMSVYQLARAMAGRWAQDMERFPLILASVDSSTQYLVNTRVLIVDGSRVDLNRDHTISKAG